MQQFYSNGKLLLTAEYFVLYGANALVFPVKYGQRLNVTYTNNNFIGWDAYDSEGHWFKAIFSRDSFKLIETTNHESASFVMKLLNAIRTLKPHYNIESGVHFLHSMNFHRNYGFGSSSTLIANMAKFAGVDPFLVHQQLSKGSAFDIAAANTSVPFIYSRTTLPKIEPVKYNPEFQDQFLFVYQNKKQKTEPHVRKLTENQNIPDEKVIEKMNLLTEKWLESTNVQSLGEVIQQHEELVADFSGLAPVKNQYTDFKGYIKSLGAWGGDFILACSELGNDYIKEYFSRKGLNLFFSLNDLKINTL